MGVGQWHRLSPHCGHGCPPGHLSGGLAFGLQGSGGGPGGGTAGQKHVPARHTNHDLDQPISHSAEFQLNADQWQRKTLVAWSRHFFHTEGRGGVGKCRRSDSSRLGGRLGCRGFPEPACLCSSLPAAARAATPCPGPETRSVKIALKCFRNRIRNLPLQCYLYSASGSRARGGTRARARGHPRSIHACAGGRGRRCAPARSHAVKRSKYT